MEHKNVVGRQVARIRGGRHWSQARLARELQKAGWDLSRSGLSKIGMRIREVNDWQMMLLVRVLQATHEAFYPKLDPAAALRDAFAEVMDKKTQSRTTRSACWDYVDEKK